MDAAAHVEAKARAAKDASRVLALAPTRTKNEALAQMARGLEEKSGTILEANRQDLERARTAGHPRAFVDRLTLTESRIEEMAAGLRQVAGLPDPVGETVETSRRPYGLEISRVRVPLGVIGFIYESRPNVTADAAGPLSQVRATRCCCAAAARPSSPTRCSPSSSPRRWRRRACRAEIIQAVETADRAAVLAMLTLDRYLDLIIPRGGEEFVRLVAERSTVPGAQARQGALPPVRGRERGSRHGGGDGGQREGPAGQRVQRAGDPARARGRRARVPAAAGRPARGGGRRDARGRAGAGPRARRPAGRARGLGHRVSRLHPRGAGGGELRGRGRPHPAARLGAGRVHRHA